MSNIILLKNCEVQSGHQKKLKTPEWASKYFLPKKLATDMASQAHLTLKYTNPASWHS